MDLKEIFNKGLFRGEIKFDQLLSAYTSLRIGGPAEVMVFPEDVVSLKNVLIEAKKENIPVFVIGSGTNLLVRDGGLDGIAICLKTFKRIEIIRNINSLPLPPHPPLTKGGQEGGKEEMGGFIGLFVEAGVPLGSLINFTKKNGYSGIEALAGIPGTFGGAVYMNAGSFGTEIKDVIISVALMNMDGRIEILEKDSLKFSYRSSNLPASTIILSANIILKKDTSENITSCVTEFLKKKKGSQPIGESSAGCVFKNPEGDYAGRLIEALGCKGMRAGDAEVSRVHANYFINRGKASSKDFIELMEIVKEKVREHSGIILETEIKIVGKDV